MLDLVFGYSQKWRFQFNTAKSKVVIFRRGSKLAKNDVFFMGLDELDIVDSIKYLGVDFQSNLSWKSTKDRLAKKARARLAIVRKAMMEGISLEAAENLWSTLIRPVLEFGGEVWGAGAWQAAEQIQQREVGSKLLGMSSHEAVRGDAGWSMRARRDLLVLDFGIKLSTYQRTDF